ncbi:MAG: MFS transporter [Verrucomicrobiales bacterium]|nr:MFS transporter [Verrucomicrobiales bacterium]
MARNIPLFIAFRLLFNARYYYPIFAVIQLDYGLTMSQFAILNAVWAVSIVLLEVPSGALADLIGRKRMVIGASLLMVLEMAVLAFVPLGNTTIVFWAWLVNRIISGAAEASASGADEALAYDSIPPDEQKKRWPKVLSRLMTLSSIASIIAMLIGSAVYDPNLLNKIFGWFGFEGELSKEDVLRIPIYLTLVNAIIAVFVSFSMKEPERDSHHGTECSMWSEIFAAGAWVLKNPFVYAIILAALVHDSIVRIFLVSTSEYYRLIEIPTAWFGVIGACFAGMGILVPKFAEYLVEKRSIKTNYILVSVSIFFGLVGISLAIPIWGVLMGLFFAFGFRLLTFFTSHYLNAEVDSKHRATVLSFRGLALNIGFGAVSLIYGGILRLVGKGEVPESEANTPFRESLYWLPGVFLLFLAAFFIYYFRKVRNRIPAEYS